MKVSFREGSVSARSRCIPELPGCVCISAVIYLKSFPTKQQTVSTQYPANGVDARNEGLDASVQIFHS